MKIIVQADDFDVSAELAELRAHHREVGAVVSFVGTVRELSSVNAINHMELEHYPGMTEEALEDIARQAIHRWKISDAVIIHRIGVLPVCAQIVLVAVASEHRGSAFEACEYIMDYLKTKAPFWKKEVAEHSTQWVDTRDSDFSALERWKSVEGD